MLEVRCCCNPNKLIGHLPVSDPEQPTVTFNVRPSAPLPVWSTGGPSPESDVETLTLQIANLATHGWGDRWRAIKANEVPVEKLRLIPGFIEA